MHRSRLASCTGNKHFGFHGAGFWETPHTVLHPVPLHKKADAFISERRSAIDLDTREHFSTKRKAFSKREQPSAWLRPWVVSGRAWAAERPLLAYKLRVSIAPRAQAHLKIAADIFKLPACYAGRVNSMICLQKSCNENARRMRRSDRRMISSGNICIGSLMIVVHVSRLQAECK